jgi:uncharacterized protein (TIGR02996 family)
MTPDNPFLQALLAEPADDTLRLALADWLDENEQPARAEFVRVQIELARGVPDRGRRRHLELRQRDLLIAHDPEWVAPLAKVLQCKPGQWGGWVFRRGFVEYFNLPAAVINKHGDQLAQLTPVRELFLRPCTADDLLAFCARPWVRSVAALHLPEVLITAPVARALVQCPHFIDLRRLVVETYTINEQWRARFENRFAGVMEAPTENWTRRGPPP